MDRRISFVTLATTDLDAARQFYLDGLGWSLLLDVPDEIIFFQIGHGMVLGLYEALKFSQDIDAESTVPATVSGLTLSQNVDSPQQVNQLLAAAEAAGARILKPGQYASFGGYHGHFADPNGVIWEIAHNPGWSVDAAGTVSLQPVG
ncbi:MAG: VOC family protein [Actinomycetota bacterium]|nr:VOC family protein [Actinomycetota bacterium]